MRAALDALDIEYIYVEEMLAKISAPELKEDILSDMCIYPVPAGATFFWRHWPMFHSAKAFDAVFLPEGIGKIVPLGKEHLRLVDTYEAVKRGIALLKEDPYKWAVPYTKPWLDRLMKAIDKQTKKIPDSSRIGDLTLYGVAIFEDCF